MHALLERQRQQQPLGLWDFGRDTHWNRDAHELVARSVASRLLDSGMLGEPLLR
jgi:hypothetical protein